MLSMLSDTEKAVVETITRGMHVEPALEFLNDEGHKMSRRTFFRYKKKIEDTKQARMQYIAEHFQEMHLEKIDRLELIDKLMWEQFEKEQQPYRKVKILESIANLQPYLTSFYESTTIAIEVSKKFNGNSSDDDKNRQLSFDEWFQTDYMRHNTPRIGNETAEENGQYYRDLQSKYNEYVKDWNNRMFGPDVESKAWAMEDDEPPSLADLPTTKEESKIPIQEAAPIIETEQNNVTEDLQDFQQNDAKKDTGKSDTIDLDIAGRYPMPIDYQYSWIQCKFVDCQKWFKTDELRNKHIAKYHIE